MVDILIGILVAIGIIIYVIGIALAPTYPVHTTNKWKDDIENY